MQLRTTQHASKDDNVVSPNSDPTLPSCDNQVCITCSDSATPARILELLPGGLATSEAGGTIEEINVELVGAGVGDLVLVHAGVAIGKL